MEVVLELFYQIQCFYCRVAKYKEMAYRTCENCWHFDLPANTFGETGVATTVIIAYKPKLSEKYLLKSDYEIFIKEIEKLVMSKQSNEQ